MKTNQPSAEAITLPVSVPKKSDNFRVEYGVRAYAGDKAAFEFSGGYDIPMGMLPEHLHASINGSNKIFECSVTNTMKMATIKFFEDLFQRQKEHQSATQPERKSAGHDSESLGFDLTPDVIKSFCDPPDEEKPLMPSFPETFPMPPAKVPSVVIPRVEQKPQGTASLDERKKKAA